MKSDRGVLLVVSGPSGAGKGTLVQEYVRRNPKVFLSVSATTRSPRDGEEDGVSYFFKSRSEFEKMIENDELIEYAEYCGNFYGTPKCHIEQLLAEGRDVILEIEVQGAMKVRSKTPDGVYIFVLPPSMEELRNRIIGRGSETEESLNRRLDRAQKEYAFINQYNYVIVNDTLDEAVQDLDDILKAEKNRIERNKNKIEEVTEHVVSFH